MTDEWLKANDPQYYSRRHLEYSYLNGAQIRRKSLKEIACSSLGSMKARDLLRITEEEALYLQELLS